MRFLIFFISCFSLSNSFCQKNKITTVIQKGHTAVVKSVVYSPDGNFVATASRDKTIKLWSVKTGAEIRTLIGHTHTVNDICFSADGLRLASSSADGTARIWNVLTGEEVWSSREFSSYVTSVSLHPKFNHIAIGSYESHVLVYDFKKEDTLYVLKSNPDRGMGYGVEVQFSPSGKLLAIGEDNREARIYEAETGNLKFTFKPENGWCGGCGTFVAFSPDEKRFLKLSNNSKLIEYNLLSGEVIKEYGDEMKGISGLSYSSAASSVLASDEHEIFIYSTVSGEIENHLKPDLKGINEAIFSHDTNSILIANQDNTSALLSSKTGDVKINFWGLNNQYLDNGLSYDAENYWESYIAKYIKYERQIELNSEGSRLFKGKTGKKAKCIDVKTGKTILEFIGHEKSVLSLALSANENKLLTGGGDGVAILWNSNSGKKIKTFKGHSEPVFDVGFSNDQTKIVTASWDGYVIVWDINSGNSLSKIYLGNVSANRVMFSPNDLYLIVSKRNKKLEMYEIDTQESVRTLFGHVDNITSLDFELKSSLFLSSGLDGNVAVWDYHTGLLKNKLKHSRPIHSAMFHKDQIITAGEDRVIRFWDKNTGTFIYELKGHQAEIVSLNTTSDGSMLVSGDLDGVIKFWNLDQRKEIFEYLQVGDHDFMVKTRDGYFYATDGAQSNIHFVRGLEVYQVGQFFEDFYRPDLILKAFSSSGVSNKTSINTALLSSPPPSLSLKGMVSKDERSVKLYVTIEDMGGGSKKLKLLHNGKSISVDTKDIVVDKKLKLYECEVDLVSGHNVFLAKASSKGNIESTPATLDVISENLVPGGNCYILSIGINKYKNTKLNLNYARADAESFTDSVLLHSKEIFQDVVVKELYDEDASKEGILSALSSLTSLMTLNDVFIIYYAGHGSVVEDEFYFIPTESVRLYDKSSLNKTAISASELQTYLEEIKALKQVIIMDACQSGKSVELLALRGVSEERAIAQLSRSAGVHIFASSNSEQFSSEFKELGHGLFTYVLLQGLSGKAEGGKNDGKITVFELKSYLDDQVPEFNLKYKGMSQYPFTFSRGQDFPLLIYK